MKKIILTSLCGVALFAFAAQAETFKGNVQDIQGDIIIVEAQDGTTKAFKTSDKTTYKHKKMMKKNKKKHGREMKKGDVYFKPMVEEDDWVELTYTPSTQNLSEAEIDEVVVYQK